MDGHCNAISKPWNIACWSHLRTADALECDVLETWSHLTFDTELDIEHKASMYGCDHCVFVHDVSYDIDARL